MIDPPFATVHLSPKRTTTWKRTKRDTMRSLERAYLCALAPAAGTVRGRVNVSALSRLSGLSRAQLRVMLARPGVRTAVRDAAKGATL